MDYFTTPPPAPIRDDPDNFATKGAAMLSYFETFIDEANTFGEVMNANAVTSQSSIDVAQVVLAAANYAGVWADLTGSLNTPASVYRNDKFWFLMVNLADVTASEPGVDPEWGLITIWDVVKTPSPQTPIMSSVNQSTLPELRADAYAHIYPSVAREYRTFQVDVVAGDFPRLFTQSMSMLITTSWKPI